jgi:hypothetical protein
VRRGETASYAGNYWAHYQPWITYGAVGGMRIATGNQSTRTKTAPIPLRAPQIPHGHRGGKPATKGLSYGTAAM